MRVLYVDYSVGFGGSFKSLALTFTGLPAVEKVLATAQDDELVRQWFPGTEIRQFRRRINYRNKVRLEMWPWPGRKLVRKPALKLFAAADAIAFCLTTLTLLRLIRRQNVDLVHLNNGFIREGAYAAWFAHVPFVVHMRGFPWDGEDQRGERDPWLVRSRAARGVAMVIGVSAPVTDSCAELSGARCTIHDPVDLAAVDRAASQREVIRAECGLAENDLAIGIVGRVVRWKGQMVFVRAILGVMRCAPNVHGIIVGDESDGAPEYFEHIRRIIAESELAHRFVLAGYRSNVEDYFAALDVVVHASIKPEPFGMVIPEAMAAGRPVIATNAGGPSEIVSHGIDGFLVPPDDVASMQAAMRTLVSDPVLRHQMGAAGRRKAVERFGIEAHARAVQNVYDHVFATSRSSAAFSGA